MELTERSAMIGPCGIDCGICELYVCKDNQKLYDYLIEKGIPKEKLPCPGCRAVEGHCPVIGGQCATFECAGEQQVDFCFECDSFPCEKLHPAADRADILPHNLKIYNLNTIRNKGLDHFIGQSAVIKQRYYKGKMAVGRGPQLP